MQGRIQKLPEPAILVKSVEKGKGLEFQTTGIFRCNFSYRPTEKGWGGGGMVVWKL